MDDYFEVFVKQKNLNLGRCFVLTISCCV